MTTHATAPRHPWISTWCQHLHDIVVGQAAQTLQHLDSGDDELVITLPTYAWLVPAISMGKKTIAPNGETFRMPVRLQWEYGPVHVLTGNRVTIEWTLSGLGHTSAGVIEITREHGAIRITGDPHITDGVQATPTSRPAQLLANLTQRGDTARWEATMFLEGYVEEAVQRATAIVSKDILHGEREAQTSPMVLDAISRDKVRDQMLLGEKDNISAVSRLIDRCLRPAVFIKVDPLKYVVTDLNRTADDYVRRAIDDPRTGTRIRRLARSMEPGSTLNDIIDAYRTLYPYDGDMSGGRVTKALTAGRDVMAHQWDLGEAMDVIQSLDLAPDAHASVVLRQVSAA